MYVQQTIESEAHIPPNALLLTVQNKQQNDQFEYKWIKMNTSNETQRRIEPVGQCCWFGIDYITCTVLW